MLDDIKPFKYICYLCGEVIDPCLKNDPMELTMDHVPPQQFYLKQIRKTEQNLNLNTAFSHRKCNEDYKEDEDYFYHSLYPIVAKNNPWMGNLYLQDLQRRAQKPQTPAKIRKILSTAVAITEGGVHLPNGMRRLTLNRERIERVVTKIARGILFLSTERYFEEQRIIRIDFYDDPSEIIKPYKDALRLESLAGVYPDVFAHSHINLQGKGFRLLLMFFWKAFMFCVIVKDTAD